MDIFGQTTENNIIWALSNQLLFSIDYFTLSNLLPLKDFSPCWHLSPSNVIIYESTIPGLGADTINFSLSVIK